MHGSGLAYRAIGMVVVGAAIGCDPVGISRPYDRPSPTASLRGLGLTPPSFDAPGFLQAFEDASRDAEIGMAQMQLAWDALPGTAEATAGMDDYAWLVEPVGMAQLDLFERSGLREGVWLSFTRPAGVTCTTAGRTAPCDAPFSRAAWRPLHT